MLLDLLKKNRSYRRFEETPAVTPEVLRACVEATRFANTSVNLQPLKYYITADPAVCAEIFPTTGWAKGIKDFPRPAEGHRPTGYIFMLNDLSISPNFAAQEKDVGICAMTAMLAATELGFGGCMLGTFNRERCMEIAGLDAERYRIALVLAIGAPGEEIILEDSEPGGSVRYYRDENFVHHVPKRTLDEIIVP